MHNFKWKNSKVVNKIRFRKSFFVNDELVSRCITCNLRIHANTRGVMVAYQRTWKYFSVSNAFQRVSNYVINQGFTSLRYSCCLSDHLLEIERV